MPEISPTISDALGPLPINSLLSTAVPPFVTPGPIKMLLLPDVIPAPLPIKTLEIPPLFAFAPIEILYELDTALAPAR